MNEKYLYILQKRNHLTLRQLGKQYTGIKMKNELIQKEKCIR